MDKLKQLIAPILLIDAEAAVSIPDLSGGDSVAIARECKPPARIIEQMVSLQQRKLHFHAHEPSIPAVNLRHKLHRSGSKWITGTQQNQYGSGIVFGQEISSPHL
ncbi:hypothetical protein [Burkholderia stagnalis]|uniref:hypothetical protein n=1 Tax=Burkholderia stagnalis TaxID=1503054 RepID=UPI0012D863BF|nr:hypothetical protein [Burkholderia stagnalis]